MRFVSKIVGVLVVTFLMQVAMQTASILTSYPLEYESGPYTDAIAFRYEQAIAKYHACNGVSQWVLNELIGLPVT